MWAKVCPLFGPPDPAGIKANGSITKGGGVPMSKTINFAQSIIGKVTGHKYTAITIKMPFANLSFAPVLIYSPIWGCFVLVYEKKKALYIALSS